MIAKNRAYNYVIISLTYISHFILYSFFTNFKMRCLLFCSCSFLINAEGHVMYTIGAEKLSMWSELDKKFQFDTWKRSGSSVVASTWEFFKAVMCTKLSFSAVCVNSS